jgi:ribokinase
VFCTRLGRDSHGETLYNYYKECGIDVGHIVIDKEYPTGFAAIMVDKKTAQNRILCYPGANRAICEEDLDNAFLSCPDALYMQLEINDEVIFYAADYAHRHDIPIFIDAGPARRDFPLEKLPPVTVFSPNEAETECYTGIRPQGMDSCLMAAHELHKRVRAEYIVLKLGERGAFVFNGTRCSFMPAFHVRAVDTTAAGDAFTAALTLRYLESGGDINDATGYANAVAALTVSKAGASYSIPSADEVAAFLKAQRTL